MNIYKGKEKEVITFFKEAFCVDGEVKVLKDIEIEDFKIKGVIELNDSRREKFYIGLLRKGKK